MADKQIEDLPEQTVAVTTDKIAMQTVGGVTKFVQLTNLKLAGWHDMKPTGGGVGGGATEPAIATFKSPHLLRNFADGAQAKSQTFIFNIPHEYVPGTQLHPHVHWSTDNASPSGNVYWQLHWTYASGASSIAFPADTTIFLTSTAAAQYEHVDTEDATGFGDADVTPDTIEAQGIIVLTVERAPAHVNDTATGVDAFLMEVGIQYQSDGRDTNERETPFTKV